MARKQSTPTESNTGLICTLVFFVLTTLTLGVFVYFGYDGQGQLRTDAEKAKKDLAAKNTELDAEKARKTALAYAAGIATEAEIKDARKSAAAFDETFGKLKEITWDKAQDRPANNETYLTIIEKLKADRDTEKTAKEKLDGQLKAAQAEFAAFRTAFDERINTANKLTEKSKTDALAELAKEREDYVKKITDIDTQSKALESEKQARSDDRSEADRNKKKLEEKNKSVVEQLEVAKSKIDSPNSLAADKPKGQILRVDRGAGHVYINLGSADFLKPQITFSVFPANTTGKIAATTQRKASIEVVTVIEPHMSVARIVSQASDLRDPLLTGDLIFNPTWSPNVRDHVALAGIFDVDGNGTDDTPEVIRNLERQGLIVDAWLDLKTRTIMGKGISERTTFLILGEKPQLSESMSRAAAQHGDNPIVQGVIQLNQKIGEMEIMAKDKGVQPLQYRTYLTVIGYPLPKLNRPIDVTAAEYLRQSTGAAAAPTTPAATSPPAEKDNPK